MVGMKKIGVALVAAGILASGAAKADLVYNSWNPAWVFNGPYVETVFSLSSNVKITSIDNYHYNNGQSVDPTGKWIGIEQIIGASSVNIGSWSVVGSVGYGGNLVNWTASPNINLGPGDYRIVDSEPATWSYSDSSGSIWGLPDGADWLPGRGFSLIYAEDAAQQSVPEPMSLALLGLGLAGLAVTRRRRTVGAV